MLSKLMIATRLERRFPVGARGIDAICAYYSCPTERLDVDEAICELFEKGAEPVGEDPFHIVMNFLTQHYATMKLKDGRVINLGVKTMEIVAPHPVASMDQAKQAAETLQTTVSDLQSYLHRQFEGSGPHRDHCFGYSCGTAITACMAINEALRSIRVALTQIEAAKR